jgi:hypothetical protein
MAGTYTANILSVEQNKQHYTIRLRKYNFAETIFLFLLNLRQNFKQSQCRMNMLLNIKTRRNLQMHNIYFILNKTHNKDVSSL